jgi:nitronate monooxygenase
MEPKEKMMPVIETALTRLLQIKHPILLAPMGSASGGRLAAAVTHAGGLGIIGSGYADSAAIKKELSAAGNARVGIGLVTWALDERPGALDTALAAQPPVLMLSFGSPQPFADAIKRAGCLLMCQVQTLAQAKEAVVSGADIIIAQGRDAGGHAGMTRGTMGLVPAIVDTVGPIPVVAAGGISDGRGLAAVLALGAAGVLMGTRFAASEESLWNGAMKDRLIAASGDETEQTRVFDIVRGFAWPRQYPGRAVKNTFLDKWHQREVELRLARPEEEEVYVNAAPDDLSIRAVWAGEGVDLVRDRLPAGDIVDRVIAQAIEVLQRGATIVKANST